MSEVLQFVLATLGAPSKVYYKVDARMLIQRGSAAEHIGGGERCDFFYNYFSLGLVSFGLNGQM